MFVPNLFHLDKFIRSVNLFTVKYEYIVDVRRWQCFIITSADLSQLALLGPKNMDLEIVYLLTGAFCLVSI